MRLYEFTNEGSLQDRLAKIKNAPAKSSSLQDRLGVDSGNKLAEFLKRFAATTGTEFSINGNSITISGEAASSFDNSQIDRWRVLGQNLIVKLTTANLGTYHLGNFDSNFVTLQK